MSFVLPKRSQTESRESRSSWDVVDNELKIKKNFKCSFAYQICAVAIFGSRSEHTKSQTLRLTKLIKNGNYCAVDRMKFVPVWFFFWSS